MANTRLASASGTAPPTSPSIGQASNCHAVRDIGTVSAKVRDQLWDAVSASAEEGVAVLVHPADNEQGFELRTAGQHRRKPIDFDGLTLIAYTGDAEPDGGKDIANPP
ncbi:type I-E CRISPR-associated endoribonuclease Cas2e [Streptomyces sp. NPDC058045]|uniref:type I-E CRISPR-associated endoribonuclease Cas2e n=1 Tax=Streptomyces sp. NPDC058045 TaxID=3346311 RepID=UPI0036EAEF03